MNKPKLHWKKNKLHCGIGPAIINKGASWSIEEWWKDGKLHCETAPAIIIKPFLSFETSRPQALYPKYTMDQKKAPVMSLLVFNKKTIFEVSTWLNNACYPGNTPFPSHGDFGAQVVVMLDDIDLLDDGERTKLMKEVEVEISDEWEEQELEKYFPENGEKMQISTDVLGSYDTKEKRIVLYIRKIVDCAERLDRELGSAKIEAPCAMTLFMVVFLHELAHALHHMMVGFKPEADLGTPQQCEPLAQHFTKTCILAYGNRALEVFSQLEKHQSLPYQIKTALEGFTWGDCKREFVARKAK